MRQTPANKVIIIFTQYTRERICLQCFYLIHPRTRTLSSLCSAAGWNSTDFCWRLTKGMDFRGSVKRTSANFFCLFVPLLSFFCQQFGAPVVVHFHFRVKTFQSFSLNESHQFWAEHGTAADCQRTKWLKPAHRKDLQRRMFSFVFEIYESVTRFRQILISIQECLKSQSSNRAPCVHRENLWTNNQSSGKEALHHTRIESKKSSKKNSSLLFLFGLFPFPFITIGAYFPGQYKNPPFLQMAIFTTHLPRFSPPQTSICMSYFPSSSNQDLSMTKRPPAIIGVLKIATPKLFRSIARKFFEKTKQDSFHSTFQLPSPLLLNLQNNLLYGLYWVVSSLINFVTRHVIPFENQIPIKTCWIKSIFTIPPCKVMCSNAIWAKNNRVS